MCLFYLFAFWCLEALRKKEYDARPDRPTVANGGGTPWVEVDGSYNYIASWKDGWNT